MIRMRLSDYPGLLGGKGQELTFLLSQFFDRDLGYLLPMQHL